MFTLSAPPSPPSSLRFSLEKQPLGASFRRISPCHAWKMTVSTGVNAVESKPSLTECAPLEAILFDVDGTCVTQIPSTSRPSRYFSHRIIPYLSVITTKLQSFYVAMQEQIGFNGGVPIDEEFYVEHFSGKHNDDLAGFFFPDDIPRGIKLMEDKEALFRKLAAEKLTAIDGLYKLRKWIEDRGLKRAAVTNAPKVNAELMISSLGLSDFFQAVVIGDECEHAKPHPDPYLKALELLNVSKEHAIIFEDSVSGATAGVAAGMPVIALTTRNPEHVLMQAKPTFLIKNYEDPKLWAALEELDKKSA